MISSQFVFGFAQAQDDGEIDARLLAAPSDLLPLTRLLATQRTLATPAADPWTDDRAPVEWITDRMIAAYAIRGSDESEVPLPTSP